MRGGGGGGPAVAQAEVVKVVNSFPA